MKYKVEYSGYAYIWADSPQDAEENFDRDNALFDEYSVDAVHEIRGFPNEVDYEKS